MKLVYIFIYILLNVLNSSKFDTDRQGNNLNEKIQKYNHFFDAKEQ
jgi:hypothetical protein